MSLTCDPYRGHCLKPWLRLFYHNKLSALKFLPRLSNIASRFTSLLPFNSGQDKSGSYFYNCKEEAADSKAMSEEDQQKLREVSMKLVGLS